MDESQKITEEQQEPRARAVPNIPRREPDPLPERPARSDSGGNKTLVILLIAALILLVIFLLLKK